MNKYFNSVRKEMGKNPAKTWRQINAAMGRKNKRKINSVRSDDGILTNKSEIVQAFNKHFSSVSSSLPTAHPHHVDDSNSRFQFKDIEEETVLRMLTTLDVKKQLDQMARQLEYEDGGTSYIEQPDYSL